MPNEHKPVVAHYDGVADRYHQQYDRDRLNDVSEPYPANYFRLQHLLNAFISRGLRKVVEVGVGEGTPLCTLGKAGIDVFGFDFSKEMVGKAKENLFNSGMDPNRIEWGDIQDPITYAALLKHGPFDGLMAMGVMPHVENDDAVLANMSAMVRPGGRVFIEFRNKLFSLFTFNRYTMEFLLDDLLANVEPSIKDIVRQALEPRLRMDAPPVREVLPGTDAPDFDAIAAKFHNPFEVVGMFQRHGYEDVQLRWYHYHPAMPFLEERMPDLFRREAIRMEQDPTDWRGHFLCSAFVVEATR